MILILIQIYAPCIRRHHLLRKRKKWVGMAIGNTTMFIFSAFLNISDDDPNTSLFVSTCFAIAIWCLSEILKLSQDFGVLRMFLRFSINTAIVINEFNSYQTIISGILTLGITLLNAWLLLDI